MSDPRVAQHAQSSCPLAHLGYGRAFPSVLLSNQSASSKTLLTRALRSQVSKAPLTSVAVCHHGQMVLILLEGGKSASAHRTDRCIPKGSDRLNSSHPKKVDVRRDMQLVCGSHALHMEVSSKKGKLAARCHGAQNSWWRDAWARTRRMPSSRSRHRRKHSAPALAPGASENLPNLLRQPIPV